MSIRFAILDSLRVLASRVRGWSTIRRLDEDFQQELQGNPANPDRYCNAESCKAEPYS
jgi:hypothetical protein